MGTQLFSHRPLAADPLNRWPDVAAAGVTCGWLALGALAVFRFVQSYRRQVQRTVQRAVGNADGNYSCETAENTTQLRVGTRGLTHHGRRSRGRDGAEVSRRRQLTKHHEEMRLRARERVLEIERLREERSKRRTGSDGCSARELNQAPDGCSNSAIQPHNVTSQAVAPAETQHRQMRVVLLLVAVACAVGTAVVGGAGQPQLFGIELMGTQLFSHRPLAADPLNRWPDVAAAGVTCGWLALGALAVFRRVQSYRRQVQRTVQRAVGNGNYSCETAENTTQLRVGTRGLTHHGRRSRGRDGAEVSRRRQLTKHHEEMRLRARERVLEIERLREERSKRRTGSDGCSARELNQAPDGCTNSAIQPHQDVS